MTETAAARVLVVDDDESLRTALTGLLVHKGHQALSAASAEEALRITAAEPVALTLLDLRLGAVSGLDILPRLKELRPDMSVIVITALATIEAAVEAMRLGADNFIVKPLDPPRLLAIVAQGLRSAALRRRTAVLERRAPAPAPELLGQSAAMKRVADLAQAVAARDTTVLITGETGVGKGLLARQIHRMSSRGRAPLLELNCAGLSRELTESELLGHERGAFTGALERKSGLLEVADEGSLLLDEIGEMDPAIQAKLLKVIEERRFRRLGGVAEISVDVRFLAATHRNLEEEVEKGRFRKDLLYRLNVFTIEVPPLRERREDILPLAHAFLAEFKGDHAGGEPRIDAEAAALLTQYEWRGNVRELRNVMERASILSAGAVDVSAEHLSGLGSGASAVPAAEAGRPLPAEGGSEAFPGVAPQRLEDAEKSLIVRTLSAHGGNIRAAARDLGISRGTLYRKARKYGIDTTE